MAAVGVAAMAVAIGQAVAWGNTPAIPRLAPAMQVALASSPQAAAASPSPQAIAPDAASGQALFTGRKAFQRGGPACSTCHTAAAIPFPSGGTMGPDLTREYSKLGPQGLAVALKTLYFPAMDPLFENRPLTAAEQKDLAAFFQGIDRQPPPSSPTATLLVAAIAGMAVLFLWTWLAVGRRRVRSVRRALLKRAGMSK